MSAESPPPAQVGDRPSGRIWAIAASARLPLWPVGGLVLLGFSWLPLSYYRMVGWAWIAAWQAGVVALGLGLGWRLRSGRAVYGLGHGLDWGVQGLAVALVLATALSPFRRVALGNVSLVVAYGLALYLYRNLVDRGWLTRQRLWWGLVAIAGGSAVISLGLWRPEAGLWATGNFWTAIRNPQPLGHHNFVGGYFVLVLPLAVAAAVAVAGPLRWLWGAIAALLLAAIYVSGSRGAALGLVVWLGCTWGWQLLRLSAAQRWRWGLGGLGGAIALGLLLATNPRIRAWFSQGLAADSSILDRWFMLRLGANILRHRPLFGVGPGAMSRVSNLYRPIEAGAGLSHIQQLHNTPVQIAGELGLVGLLGVAVGVGLLLLLGWRLGKQPLEPADRALLGGIGGSLLAYGATSLTDYQLENIPIAGTLVAVVVMLVALGDRYLGAPQAIAPARCRRAWPGLALLLGLLVAAGLPFTLTVAYGALAEGAFDRHQINLADSRWYKAHRLSPWDPTAPAVASEALGELDQKLGPSEAKQNLRSLAVEYATLAQRAAPNDGWFNHNLAVLHQATDPAAALPYAARAVQLMPRHSHHGYWLLGDLLLATGDAEGAVAAFTLEALVDPAVVTAPQWQRAPYRAVATAVVAATLTEYDALLAQVPPTDPGYGPLYESRALLGWWTQQAGNKIDSDRLRPVVSALLRAEDNPAAALAQVEAALLAQPAPELNLLAAWLAPAAHAPWPRHPASAASALVEESLALRSLRPWLSALISAPEGQSRGSLAFAYRNYQARHISLMLTPPTLQRYTLVAQLNLFSPWSREFPALDRRIDALRTAALGLPHPTHNGFRL